MVATRKRQKVDVKAKITSKGQITLPQAVREHFGFKAGQELHFIEDAEGRIFVQRYVDPATFQEWRGFLKHLAGKDSDEIVREMRGD
jgi:AbrB family looped-hinge helix DNA binding protein